MNNYMDFSSVELNLFKKVQYFRLLKEFDRQFKPQLEILSDQSPEDHKNYASWEVEKRILFWSYLYHKYWGDVVRSEHLNKKSMFLDTSEVRGSFFHNLEERGFGKQTSEGIILNRVGRDFGGLVWYLYDIKKYPLSKYEVYLNKFRVIFGIDDSTELYKEVFPKAEYYLQKNLWGLAVLTMQEWALILLMFFGASFILLEVLGSVGLLDNLVSFFKTNFYFPSIYIIVLTSPVILLVLSFWLHVCYQPKLKYKYKYLEKEKYRIRMKNNLVNL